MAEPKTIGICGAGVMGSQLAALFAGAGSDAAGITSFSFGLQASTVPEPTRLAMLGLGAFGLVGYRRRKQKQDAPS